MSNNVISSTLKSLRKEHGLTQVDLAMKSGVSLTLPLTEKPFKSIPVHQ